jgi:hypothetical protein
MSREKQKLILYLLSMVLFDTKKHHKKYHQGGIVMEYQGWLFANFYFWSGSFFGSPGRGEVC